MALRGPEVLRPHVPKRIKHLGISLTVAQWAERLGICRDQMLERLAKYPRHIALDPDPEARIEYGREASRALYLWGGAELTVSDIMEMEGVSRRTVYNWVEAGRIKRVSGPRKGRYA